jgi:hypothetical protein
VPDFVSIAGVGIKPGIHLEALMAGKNLSTSENRTRKNDQATTSHDQATASNGQNAVNTMVPYWDGETRTLFFCGRIVKDFRTKAGNQIKIIEAFAAKGWMQRIENPLARKNNNASRTRLYQTLKRLNQHQKQANFRFHCDGTGHGIIWKSY